MQNYRYAQFWTTNTKLYAKSKGGNVMMSINNEELLNGRPAGLVDESNNHQLNSCLIDRMQSDDLSIYCIYRIILIHALEFRCKPAPGDDVWFVSGFHSHSDCY